MRLIDADELVKAIDGNPFTTDSVKSYIHVSVAKMPTIEPQRKKGKWIHGREIAREMIGDCTTAIFYDGWTCSECGCLVEKEREPLYKYCPQCGSYNGEESDDIPNEYFESGGK